MTTDYPHEDLVSNRHQILLHVVVETDVLWLEALPDASPPSLDAVLWGLPIARKKMM